MIAVITYQSFSLRKSRDIGNDNWYFIDVKYVSTGRFLG